MAQTDCLHSILETFNQHLVQIAFEMADLQSFWYLTIDRLSIHYHVPMFVNSAWPHSVDRRNEYRPKGYDAVHLGSNGRYGL